MKAPAIASAKPQPDEASCVYSAGVLLGHLAALEQEVQGVAAGEKDIEYIHRARVASRRLRAALPLFQACLPEKKAKTWLRQIRDVMRALGAARDLDVQIERVNTFIAAQADLRNRAGLVRLRLRLNQQRARAQVEVTRTMQAFIDSKTVEAMREYLTRLDSRKDAIYLYTPTLYQHGFTAIRERLDGLLSYSDIVHDPEKVTELHEMRIAAKWLRYTMETFAPLYANQLKPYLKAVRSIQEQLGDIHDCDVWQQFLEEFLTAEQQRIQDYFGHVRPYSRLVKGIRAFEQERRQAREQTYAAFVQDWDDWGSAAKKSGPIWEDLIRTIQIPFPQPESIYPPLEPPDTSSTVD